MYCPFCRAEETKVIDSRLVGEGMQVRRRRECILCNERFTTFESAELVLPHVIKRDGTRVPFDKDKLHLSLSRALEKRPVSIEQIDIAVERIIHRLRAGGEREISSKIVGESVMEELRALDKVAYVRYASVYRSFEDVSEFHKEIEKLNSHGK